MAQLKILNLHNNLYEEMSGSPSVLGKKRDYIYSFLTERGIVSLSDVSTDTLTAFIKRVRRDFYFDQKKIFSFKGDLETVYFNFMKLEGHPLTQIPLPENTNPPKLKKALIFLMASGIMDLSEISAVIRKAYEAYLLESVPAKASEYLKTLDILKLFDLRKQPFLDEISYENQLLYLGYYKDPQIAQRFYYTQTKKFLYFDFSLPASLTLKKQIFLILKEDLSHTGERTMHYMMQHYITPLHYLYDFCVQEKIADLKQVRKEQIQSFEQYLTDHMDSIYKGASTAMYRARKFLFLADKKPDFTASAWFIERFDLSRRANPTRNVEAFYFDDMSVENGIYFKHYMRYLLVLSPKYSLQGLLEKYYSAKEFIRFLENRNGSLSEISYPDIESYINWKDASNCSPATYNNALTRLSFFLTCLHTREHLLVPSFPFEHFYKKAYYLHHDRSVPESIIDRIFTVLPDFPETIGLIFLTLYSTGLRINEVCSLRKDALFIRNDTHWLSVYQYKLKTDKEIPIPSELFRLLNRHIEEQQSPAEFIFTAIQHKDRPYQASTFVKQFKATLLLYDQTQDIVFRTHDFRHTVATDLYYSGAGLQTTRAFLGHSRDDMTKQYIDHLPGHIDKLQEQYFEENDS